MLYFTERPAKVKQTPQKTVNTATSSSEEDSSFTSKSVKSGTDLPINTPPPKMDPVSAVVTDEIDDDCNGNLEKLLQRPNRPSATHVEVSRLNILDTMDGLSVAPGPDFPLNTLVEDYFVPVWASRHRRRQKLVMQGNV